MNKTQSNTLIQMGWKQNDDLFKKVILFEKGKFRIKFYKDKLRVGVRRSPKFAIAKKSNDEENKFTIVYFCLEFKDVLKYLEDKKI